MDKATIDANQIVERYVQGKLSETDLEEFEIYILEHPEILDDIEYAKGMHDAIANEGEELFDLKTEQNKPAMFATPYAMAATVMLGVMVAFSAYQYRVIDELERETRDGEPVNAVDREYYLEPVRSDLAQVLKSDGNETLLLRIATGPSQAELFSIEVRDAAGELEWAIADVIPTNGLLTVTVTGIPAGRFSLAVIDQSNSAVSVEYAIEIFDDDS